MDKEKHLDYLSDDYAKYMGSGEPFQQFFCPILQTDEKTELIIGHIINQSFPESSRAWTIQRGDVDHFYGTYFESEFTKLQYEGTRIEEALADKSLYKKLKPSLLHEGEPIEMYPASRGIGKTHSPLEFTDAGNQLFGVKLTPHQMEEKVGEQWQLVYEVDATLESIVSLIKSAHLTLFHLLGYRYVRTSSSIFMGNDILGRFFRQNCNEKDRNVVRANAIQFFDEFKQLVRPVKEMGWVSKGTLTDNTVLVCRNMKNNVWAMIVFIFIGGKKPLHAVVTPLLHNEDSIDTFTLFLKGRIPKIEVAACRFEDNVDMWNIDTNWYPMEWVQG